MFSVLLGFFQNPQESIELIRELRATYEFVKKEKADPTSLYNQLVSLSQRTVSQ